jgi:AraC family transcriptional regulator
MERTGRTHGKPRNTLSITISPVGLVAIESERSLPTSRVVFECAKILNVIEGAVDVETADGSVTLTPGMSLALGKGRWCKLRPRPMVRVWTIYVDEDFLRTQMAWFLPDVRRIRAGLQPHQWNGGALVYDAGARTLHEVEPVWRQLSVLCSETSPPEMIATRMLELFARWVRIVVPTFLTPGLEASTGIPAEGPINGHLTDSTMVGHIGGAVRLLRENMDKPWTAESLARVVALSRTHLNRLFLQHTGITPMRFLTEVRLTEFTRLVEETDFTVGHAANTVGWSDPRVASTWFRRRFGLTPMQYRASPHPAWNEGEEPGVREARPLR